MKPKQPKYKRSLLYTIWLYFMLFLTIVLLLLWLFQVVLMPWYYQNMKTRNIISVAMSIAREAGSPDFSSKLKSLAYENSMCIEILDKYGRELYSEDMMGGNCLIHGRNSDVMYSYMKELNTDEDGTIYYNVHNELYNNETLLFGLRLDTEDGIAGYLFINTSLEPLKSTVNIINDQLFLISVIMILVSAVISFLMARRIADPISRITKSAKRLGNGEYGVKFEGGSYIEAQTLSDTLNYASEEISKVDSLRKDLIANISHDLRTPLTIVKSYAEMIRDLSGDNPVKREQHIGVIIAETDRLAALVNDILDVSRIESGNQELNITSFPITAKLEEVLLRYKILSEQQGYKFIFTPDEECMVRADVIKIEQVIYNLINNAVNYTGADKTIYIKQINGEHSVRIEITDTGEGIAEELLPVIFDRYYRAEKSKREVVGTGLGLSIVKAILKQHNFPFGVQSEIGKGSTFWFEVTIDGEKGVLYKDGLEAKITTGPASID